MQLSVIINESFPVVSPRSTPRQKAEIIYWVDVILQVKESIIEDIIARVIYLLVYIVNAS